MNANTPETRCWIVGDVLATAVTEGSFTTVTLTCTTPTAVDTVQAALATLAQTLQQTAHERKAVTA